MNRSWRKAQSLLVVVGFSLLVLSGTLATAYVVAASNAPSPIAPANAGLPFANAPNAPAVVRDLKAPAALSGPESAALNDSVARTAQGEAPTVADLWEALAASGSDGSLAADFSQVPQSYVNAEYNATVAEMGGSSGLHVAGCVSCALDAGVPAFAVAVIVCAAGGAESFGVACLAGFAAAAAIIALSYFFGWGVATATTSGTYQAIAEGETIILNSIQKDLLVEQSWTTLLTALNTSLNAFEYEAASAVLVSPTGDPLIDNGTWNPYIDLTLSGVAEQLDSVISSYDLQLSSVVAETAAQAFVTLGNPADYGSKGCPLELSESYLYVGAYTTSLACGGSTTGAVGTDYGQYGAYFHAQIGGASCAVADVYVQGGSTVILNGSAGVSPNAQLTAHNLATGQWMNVSASAIMSAKLMNDTNFTTGVWALNTTSTHSWYFYGNLAIPANDATLTGCMGGNYLADEILVGSTATGSTYPWTSWGPIQIGELAINEGSEITIPSDFGSSSYTIGDLSTAGSSAFVWITVLLTDAANVGEAYWAFLHTLGYYSVSSIPKSCYIPPPSLLIASNVPPIELASANWTQVYNLYLVTLNALGNDFVTTLGSSTFCDHKTPNPLWNTTVGFSVYGLGYVYNPPTVGTPVVASNVSKVAGGATTVGGLVVTTGETIVVAITGAESTGPSAVTDSAGNSFHILTGHGTTYTGLWVYTANDTTKASGSDTITVAGSSLSNVAITAEAIQNAGSVSGFSGVQSGSGPKTLTWTATHTEPSINLVTLTSNTAGGGPAPSFVGPTGFTGNYSVGSGAAGSASPYAYGTTYAVASNSSAAQLDTYAGTAGASPAQVLAAGLTVTAGGSAITNANATAPQSFANPETWNYSGAVFLIPALYSLAVPVNETWELSSANVYDAYIVPLVANLTTAGQVHVVADGPTTCVDSGQNCVQQSLKAYLLTNLIGNSSEVGGQKYTTGIANRTAGSAVYFVGCESATSSANFVNPIYHSTSSCGFNVSTVNGTGKGCVTLGPDSQCCALGGCPPPPPPNGGSCGGTYLSWLATPILDTIGSIPIIGTCAVAEIIALIVLVLIVVFVVWLIATAARVARGR